MASVAYNYLITSYMNGTSLSSSNKVHKRSELRSIYNTIIKINKNSPLYKVDLTKENQTFAIGIKDLSLQISDTAKSLYNESPDSVFNSTKAYTEDESSASVHLVTDDKSRFPESFDLKVNSLATNQVNKSLSVFSNATSPTPGNYAFTVTLDETSYSFQYNIKENTTNEDTLTKLSDFINKSGIGLTCSTIKNENNTIQMILESDETGTTGEPIFTLDDTKSPGNANGLIEFYGLNANIKNSQNAQFEINGEPKEALSNQILLNKALEIDFINPSQTPAKIGYLPDSEAILSTIDSFRSQYNKIVDLANAYDSVQGMSQKLLFKLQKTAAPYLNELESCGITFDKSGKIEMDEFLSTQSIESKEINDLFSSNGYLNRVDKQVSSIIINPMEYVDKTLVTYPNFTKASTSNSYVSSIYSGMLFNYYC